MSSLSKKVVDLTPKDLIKLTLAFLFLRMWWRAIDQVINERYGSRIRAWSKERNEKYQKRKK